MITSLRRYGDLLGWLLADIWSTCPRYVAGVYLLDVIGLATMAGAYGLGRKILAQASRQGGVVQFCGREWSLLLAIGVGAGLILFALVMQSGARLGSHRVVLALAEKYEASTVFKIWDKLRECRSAHNVLDELSDPKSLHRLMSTQGRAMGTFARLGVMAISATLNALFFCVLAIHSAPKTAVVILVVGVGVFCLMIRSNRRAVLASRCSQELGGQVRSKLLEIASDYAQAADLGKLDQRLRALYSNGVSLRALQASTEQLYRVYESQFLMSLGAAFAIALSVLLPFFEQPKGGAAVPVAMTAAGLVFLKQAFGFAGTAAGNLTRLNLRYHLLVDHRRFLRTGALPKASHGGGEVAEENEEV